MSAEQTLPAVAAYPRPEERRDVGQPAALFSDLVVSRSRPQPNVATRLLPLSLLIHGALVAAAIAVPLLSPDTLPEPQQALRAFLVSPPDVALPPPPPPPRAASAPRPTAPAEPTQVASFVAPIEVPDALVPDVGLDLGIEGGVAGGVAGGVPGGVVGGVVGGLPLAAPPPLDPLRVGGEITEPTKLRHVSPEYPRLAQEARLEGIVVLECTISPAGRVTAVSVLRGHPLLDRAAIDAVKQWAYTPTLIGGIPVPILNVVTVRFVLS